MKSEDIVQKLSALRSKRDEQRDEYRQAVEEYKTAAEQTETIRKAYLELQKRHDEAKQKSDKAKAAAKAAELDGRETVDEIERLERELNRLRDAEAIEERYRRKVEEMREKSLEAHWRKENRDDGYGAQEYQIDGAIHLAVAEQAICADKRGLGKSLTSLIYADLRDAMKVIAIVPGDTVDNFIREIKRWSPHRSPIKLSRMPKGKRELLLESLASGFVPEYFLVLNFESWRRDSTLIDKLIRLRADTLIIDEAHHGKDINSNAGEGLQSIRFGMNKCPACDSPEIKPTRTPVGEIISGTCRMCGETGEVLKFCTIKNVLPMTGTPIMNKPQELFPLLRLVDRENFKSEKMFLRDFCMMTNGRRWIWQPGAEKNIMDKIGPRFLSRTRESAGVVIPPAAHIIHSIPFEDMVRDYPKQAKAYKQARDYAQIVLDPDKKISMSMAYFIVVQMRLRQMLTWPGSIELKYKDEETKEEIVVASLDVHESIKLDRIENDIREVVEEGERAVLFSQFTDPLNVLQERLGSRAIVYDGNTRHSLRNEIQLDFDVKTASKQPRWDVVLCNFKAAGEGLNLNTASQMFILDEKWNPAYMTQAYGRIDRMGQTRDTTIHTYRVEDSIDEWMAALIATKGDMINGFEQSADVMRDMYEALRNGEL